MKRLLSVLFLFVIFLLTGCGASGPAFCPAENPDMSNQGLIYIYRPGCFLGGGTDIVPHIYLDEIEQGQLKYKGYLVFPAKPGKRMVEAKLGWFSQQVLTIYIDVEEGQDYYVRWLLGYDLLCETYSLGLVPEEIALSEIQDTKFSKPGPLDFLN